MSFNVVMAPGHLTHKWVREIEETLPDTVGRIIRSITDLYDAQREFRKGDKSIYAVISKERARDSYARKPSVLYVGRKKVFACPHCYKPVMMELSQDGSKYLVEADQFYFTNESSKNHKCQECGEVLWSAVNPDDRRLSSNRWVKIAGIGFVYREHVHEHIAACSAPDIIKDLIDLRDNPDEYFPIPCAYKRFGLSRFIRKKIKKISSAVLDEVHMYKGDTGVGNAMAELIKSARKVVAMTATLINGYSSGIFYILYRLVPGLMLTDGREYENPRPFNTEYGVVENTYELKDDPYNVTSRSRKVKKRERMLPGVSPLVFTRFLLENSAFLSLADMTASMPEYEEIPVVLEMKDEVAKEYKSIENTLKRIMKTEKSLSRKILARYLDILSIYPDMPYGHGDILSPEDGSVLLSPQDTGEPCEVYEKDLKVLEIVREKTAKGGRVLIYTNWVKTDSQDKLLNLLRNEGFKTEVLSVSVAPEKREEWVSKQVESGIQCLITNPALVETGLDLNDFTTIVFYNVGYNLFTFRQASRRSWRINQKAPRVEVYILYYNGTMQNRAIKLMASKLAVATTIEGNISDEGLAAMSECSDMTSLMARELAMGIESKVDDIAAIYKKMAILRHDEEKQADTIEVDSGLEVITLVESIGQEITDSISMDSVGIESVFICKSRKKRQIDGQLTLFELFDMSIPA